jgi:hypothetical protein
MEKRGAVEHVNTASTPLSIDETFARLGFSSDGARVKFLKRTGGQQVERAPGRPVLPVTGDSLPPSK